MSQRRIQDFGSPIVASSLKTLSNSFAASAVLDGFQFLVDAPDRMAINPGSAITHEGVIIIEDEVKFLDISNTSNAVDYTVFYAHEDQDVSGGVPAVLTIQSGLLTADVVNGVILGYVRYPGGGVPLSAAHFVQAPPLRIGVFQPTRENADWIFLIRNNNYLVTQTSGGTIDITDVFDTSGTKPEMFVRFRNNSASSGSVTIVLPFKIKNQPFALTELVIATDINATITPSLIDSDGDVFVLTVTPFSGNPNLILNTVGIPREAVQTPNTLVYLQLEISLAINREAKIQAVGLNEFNLPI